MGFNKVNFYYFSGTGNTLLVVRKIKEMFEAGGITVSLHRIETSKAESIDPDSPIGLAFTVAAQGTYPFVWDFIKSLPHAGGTPIFMVDTLAAFSGGIVGPVRKIVEGKGYRPIGAREICMPTNFFPGKVITGKDTVRREKGIKQAERFARNVLTGKSRWGRIPVLSDLISKISLSKRTWKILRKIFCLKVDASRCVKCGLCVKLCPVNNIKMEEFPEFLDKCVVCMRCISFCPKGAIYKEKGGYEIYRAVNAEELLQD